MEHKARSLCIPFQGIFGWRGCCASEYAPRPSPLCAWITLERSWVRNLNVNSRSASSLTLIWHYLLLGLSSRELSCALWIVLVTRVIRVSGKTNGFHITTLNQSALEHQIWSNSEQNLNVLVLFSPLFGMQGSKQNFCRFQFAAGWEDHDMQCMHGQLAMPWGILNIMDNFVWI